MAFNGNRKSIIENQFSRATSNFCVILFSTFILSIHFLSRFLSEYCLKLDFLYKNFVHLFLAIESHKICTKKLNPTLFKGNFLKKGCLTLSLSLKYPCPAFQTAIWDSIFAFYKRFPKDQKKDSLRLPKSNSTQPHVERTDCRQLGYWQL